MRRALLLSVLLSAGLAQGACGDESSQLLPTTSAGASDGTGGGSAGSTSANSGGSGSSSGGAGGTIEPGPKTSPGCVDGNGLAEGEHTFSLEGLDRRYILRLPTKYDPNVPWPLVLALHGNGGSTAY